MFGIDAVGELGVKQVKVGSPGNELIPTTFPGQQMFIARAYFWCEKRSNEFSFVIRFQV
jgi:hypothetical protein